MQRVVWMCLGLLACGLSLLDSGQAASAAYQWRTLDVGIEVESTGDLLITETQRYDVTGTQALRLQRTIPLSHVDSIADVEVFENAQALTVSTGSQGEQFRIRWRAPRQPEHQWRETRTFVLRYRVEGAVSVLPEGDQIVWTALHGGRETPLRQGSVTLRVPSELAGEIQDSKSYGAPATVRQLDARTLSFEPRNELQPEATLKVKVIVPHGRLQASMPKWQQGIDVPYALPGLLGRIDTIVLVVVGIGLFACLYYAISSSVYEEDPGMAQHMGLDRDAGTYRPGDHVRPPPP